MQKTNNNIKIYFCISDIDNCLKRAQYLRPPMLAKNKPI